ncbi:uncharacterized protein TNCV_2253951 [Trichonephila clavipes]|nr:uncharacterized protein TNCV_2253951 [Trichonephila clavipes]
MCTQATAYQEGSCTILHAVCNIDSSTQPGSHWIAFYLLSPNEGEFFDSYGNEPTYFTGPIANFALRYNRMNNNPMTLQSNKTAVCGQYCLYYLYSRCRDYNLPGITSENHAFEDEHTVQKDESVKLKEVSE